MSNVIWLTTKHSNCRINAKQSPCKVTNDQCVCTAFAQRPLCALCAPAELLLRCRRPYCAAMVTLRCPLCTLLERRANADRRCLFWVCSKCAPSLGVLCDPTVSNGDATALLRWCLRSYCAHLGVLHFLRTPWDHREDAALVWQRF